MSQTKIIIAVVVVLVVVVGFLAFMRSKTDIGAMAPQTGMMGQPMQSTETNGKKMAFAEFIKQGGSYKCTVNQSVGGVDAKGITYMSDGKMRGEYAMHMQGMDMNSISIVKDGYTYSWSSMAPTMGFKRKLNQPAPTNVPAEASGAYSFNAEQIGDYECEAWVPDASKFSLPPEVIFTEMK